MSSDKATLTRKRMAKIWIIRKRRKPAIMMMARIIKARREITIETNDEWI
jgi:hypothetical protein